jgi:hypothetical protein
MQSWKISSSHGLCWKWCLVCDLIKLHIAYTWLRAVVDVLQDALDYLNPQYTQNNMRQPLIMCMFYVQYEKRCHRPNLHSSTELSIWWNGNCLPVPNSSSGSVGDFYCAQEWNLGAQYSNLFCEAGERQEESTEVDSIRAVYWSQCCKLYMGTSYNTFILIELCSMRLVLSNKGRITLLPALCESRLSTMCNKHLVMQSQSDCAMAPFKVSERLLLYIKISCAI